MAVIWPGRQTRDDVGLDNLTVMRERIRRGFEVGMHTAKMSPVRLDVRCALIKDLPILYGSFVYLNI